MKRISLLLTLVFTLLLGLSIAQAQYYGESFDETEQLAVANTFQYALENNQSGTEASWNNPDSAHSGSTIPLRTFLTTEGISCREYQQIILIGEKEEQGFGTACRQPDGSWRIIDPGSVSDVSQYTGNEIPRVYHYYDPWAFAYPYPYAYFPHHIAFSFGFIHHNGHFFSGHRHFNRHNKYYRAGGGQRGGKAITRSGRGHRGGNTFTRSGGGQRGGNTVSRSGGGQRGGNTFTRGGGGQRGGKTITRNGGGHRGGNTFTRSGGGQRGGNTITRSGGGHRGGNTFTRGGGGHRGGKTITRSGGGQRGGCRGRC